LEIKNNETRGAEDLAFYLPTAKEVLHTHQQRSTGSGFDGPTEKVCPRLAYPWAELAQAKCGSCERELSGNLMAGVGQCWEAKELNKL
jgi:hypothetical protein